MIAVDTVEERILELQQRKAELASIAFSESGGLAFNAEDIDFLFGKDAEQEAPRRRKPLKPDGQNRLARLLPKIRQHLAACVPAQLHHAARLPHSIDKLADFSVPKPPPPSSTNPAKP